VDGKLAQLMDFASPTATLNDTTVVEAIVKNPSLKKLAPRLGFAWDPGGNGKMAVRGGIGVFYELVTVNTPLVQNTSVRVPPFINRGGLVGSSSFRIDFPDAFVTQQALLAGQSALEGTQYEPDQPSMYKWNLNVQRELLPRTTLELGYTGTRGVNLFRLIYTNGREGVLNADGRLQVPPGQPLRQPNFQRMRYRISDGTSDYHGLTIGLTRRAGENFQAQVSYTWSKTIDEGGSALGSADFTNETQGSRYFFMKDRGLAAFDTRHSFTTNVNYMLPFGRDGSGLGAALVRNWNIGTVLRLRTRGMA
jgi:hypothetical protein